MKQVIFAIALLAMASLTGCLTDDESSVDETTDTTSDNSGNTNQDGTIDPVGQTGVTIPEDSSVFMDSYGAIGQWDCTGNGKDKVCNFDFNDKDSFVNSFNGDGTLSGVSYEDSDGITNILGFNGWVNKTGNTVTIEPLKFPDRGPRVYTEGGYTVYNYQYINGYLTNTCNDGNQCKIIFYGHNGLTFDAWFTLSSSSTSWHHDEDTDDDGTVDTRYYYREYAYYTPTFELPFEPYGFTLSRSTSVDTSFSRIF